MRAPVTAARVADFRSQRPSLSTLRMGGGNVPRVPYKLPGDGGFQVCLVVVVRADRDA